MAVLTASVLAAVVTWILRNTASIITSAVGSTDLMAAVTLRAQPPHVIPGSISSIIFIAFQMSGQKYPSADMGLPSVTGSRGPHENNYGITS